MKLDRRKNTKNGIIYGIVSRIITLLMNFVVQTALIKLLGAEYAGINGLFYSLLTVLNLSELGIGSAVVFSMYKPIAEDDTATIEALFCLYRKLYFLVGAVILAIGCVILPFISKFINGIYPDDINIYLLFILVLANTVLSYWVFASPSVLLNAYQRNDIISRVHIAGDILMYSAQVLAIWITGNFYIYYAISILGTIGKNYAVACKVSKMYPNIKCKGSLRAEAKVKIKYQIAGLSISKLCITTRNTFDNIFISAFLGLVSTTIYSNYYYIISALTLIMSIITNSLLAGIGNTVATEKKEKNYSEFLKLDFIYMVVSGWMTVCLVCLFQPFMKIWVGDELMLPDSTMLIFSTYFYLLKMGDIRSVYAKAAGLFWEERYRMIAEAVLNLIMNLLFVQWLGIFGVVLATCITIFIFGFLGSAHVLFKYYFKSGMRRYLLNQLRYFLVTLTISVLTVMACNSVDIIIPNVSIWYILIIRGLCCITVVPGLFWLLTHRTKEYESAMKLLKRK